MTPATVTFTGNSLPASPQRQISKLTPSELARLRQRTPRLPTTPAEMALVCESKKQALQRLPSVSSPLVIKKTSIGSDVPVSPPVTSVLQQKTISTRTLPRKTETVGDDFEFVGQDDADEEFDVLSSEGPSALNGTSQTRPDDIMDDLEGAFRSLSKSVLDWRHGH
jgi:hypothetical protein